MGPLLFLICILNDITDSLLSFTRIFAGECSVFYAATAIVDFEGIITHDLLLLATWAKQ